MKKKIDWESGINETITFIILFPFIIAGFLLIMYAMQMSMVKQTMQYTAYSATRAAILQDTEDNGRNKGSDVVHSQLDGKYSIHDVNYDITIIPSSTGYSTWTKGTLVEGKASCKIYSLAPFTGNAERELSASIVMMVERLK